MLAPYGRSSKSRMARAAMLDDGAPIGVADTLIVGITCDAGSMLVTRNDDFERVPQLQVSVLASEH